MGILIKSYEMESVLKDFYKLTGLRIAIFDEYRNEIIAYPKDICALCLYLRESNPLLDNRCHESDRVAFEKASKMRVPYIYQCHLGLTEAVSAIYSGNIVVGYIMFGQLIQEGVSEAVKSKIPDADAKPEHLVKSIPILNSDKINACASIMNICLSYIMQNKYVKYDYAGIGERIKKYLDCNLCNRLTVDGLKRRFNLSHTTIHKIFKAEEGCGVMQYLNRLRMNKAVRLLKTTKLTQGEIAGLTGIGDANYFSRAFKKIYEMTPSDYRNRYCESL